MTRNTLAIAKEILFDLKSFQCNKWRPVRTGLMTDITDQEGGFDLYAGVCRMTSEIV